MGWDPAASPGVSCIRQKRRREEEQGAAEWGLTVMVIDCGSWITLRNLPATARLLARQGLSRACMSSLNFPQSDTLSLAVEQSEL
jgi:hypothetical protein